MLVEVEEKLRKKHKILFSRDSECLQNLLALIRKQHHRTLVLWAFTCVDIPLAYVKEKYPSEMRASNAFTLCQKWARGEVKMPIAKKAILQCHSIGKELTDEVDIALYHAIGQGLSCVHVETHAIGLAIYELTAIVLANREAYEAKVMDKIQYYSTTLQDIAAHIDEIVYPWAAFLCDDTKPNKEDVLWKKKERLK